MMRNHSLPGVVKEIKHDGSQTTVILSYAYRHTAVGKGKTQAYAFSKALKALVKKVIKPFVRKIQYGPGTNGMHCVGLQNKFEYAHIRHKHCAKGYGISRQKAEDDAWSNLLGLLSRDKIFELLRHGYDEGRVALDALEPRPRNLDF